MSLVEKLENHVAGMAPHQKERRAGQLLIESLARLKELEKRSGHESQAPLEASQPAALESQ